MRDCRKQKKNFVKNTTQVKAVLQVQPDLNTSRGKTLGDKLNVKCIILVRSCG